MFAQHPQAALIILLDFSQPSCCTRWMSEKHPDLEAAYALSGAEENRALYARWAPDYDRGFAADMDYILPQHVALYFNRFESEGPVLDVGAGTGLLGVCLADQDTGPIDALDLSSEMLEVARQKNIYRDLITADLEQALPLPAAHYGAVVSAGTFTNGHLGPDVLDALIDLGKPSALFVVSINAAHWQSQGFARKFSALAGVVSDLKVFEVPIYGAQARGSHSADLAKIAVFRRAAP